MRSVQVLAGLFLMAAGSAAVHPPATMEQVHESGTLLQSEPALPSDIFPDSRSRLPSIKREDLDERARKAYDEAASASSSGVPQGAAAIRLHASGVDVRCASPLGRRLTELTILATAREREQPYEWSLHELEGVSVGLDPATIVPAHTGTLLLWAILDRMIFRFCHGR